ncbi:MAG: hypothetical protein CSA81_12940 [Acidobacteria bacterium]|nr:MAG: hypothetical protein CSA81_12940 [Acidobacteriota bacterium]PIE89125.1 MAG: hypothetical protein CR997_12680 [Acidobacteriota bacterium]
MHQYMTPSLFFFVIYTGLAVLSLVKIRTKSGKLFGFFLISKSLSSLMSILYQITYLNRGDQLTQWFFEVFGRYFSYANSYIEVILLALGLLFLFKESQEAFNVKESGYFVD